jgi:hypothetical protein
MTETDSEHTDRGDFLSDRTLSYHTRVVHCHENDKPFPVCYLNKPIVNIFFIMNR